MNLDLPKDWKKILIWGVGIIIFAVVLFLYSEYELNDYDTKTSNIIADKDRLEIGRPKYVEHKDINTNDPYYKEDDNSKYSQITVKNISDETIYELGIKLKEQEMEDPSGGLIQSYYLDILDPGESAVLSLKHENIKDNEKLEINEYSYCDGKGTSYRVTEYLEDGDSKLRISSESNDKLYKFKDISSEVDILSIEIVSEKEEKNKIYYEVEIKNNSDVDIRDVYLNFNEYHENNIVGNNVKAYEGTLKSGGTITLNIESKKGIKLDLVSYRYNSQDESDKNKIITNYNIYIKQGKYEIFEYEDYEITSRKRILSSIINLVVISIFGILDSIAKKMQTKGKLEDNEIYITRGKNLIKAKYILFVLYIVALIIYMFYD